MPPIYCYQCDHCQIEREIVRPMSDSDKELTHEEFGDHKLACVEHLRKYNKLIKHAPQKVYGANWGYRKGKGYDW